MSNDVVCEKCQRTFPIPEENGHLVRCPVCLYIQPIRTQRPTFRARLLQRADSLVAWILGRVGYTAALPTGAGPALLAAGIVIGTIAAVSVQWLAGQLPPLTSMLDYSSLASSGEQGTFQGTGSTGQPAGPFTVEGRWELKWDCAPAPQFIRVVPQSEQLAQQIGPIVIGSRVPPAPQGSRQFQQGGAYVIDFDDHYQGQWRLEVIELDDP